MTGGASAAAVWAFPGQGVAADALRAALAANAGDPLVEALHLRTGVTDWDAVDFRDTELAQPAVYVAGVVSATKAAVPPPRLVLGHSLGELTALAVAGAFDPEEGIELVRQRAIASRDAASRGSMVALMGLDEPAIEWLRRRAIGHTGGVLEIAAYNGRRQIVLSGDVTTVEKAVGLGGAAGALIQRLPIGGGFHSPLMVTAAERFRAAIQDAAIRSPQTPWLSTIDVVQHTEPHEICEALVRAFVMPVRWLDAVEHLDDQGHRLLIDMGPDAVLAKLARRSRLRLQASTVAGAEREAAGA